MPASAQIVKHMVVTAVTGTTITLEITTEPGTDMPGDITLPAASLTCCARGFFVVGETVLLGLSKHG